MQARDSHAKRKKSTGGRFEAEFSSKLSKQINVAAKSQKPQKEKEKPKPQTQTQSKQVTVISALQNLKMGTLQEIKAKIYTASKFSNSKLIITDTFGHFRAHIEASL